MFYHKTKNKEYIKNSRRCIFLLLLLFFYAFNTNAQHDTLKEKKYSIEFQIFANTNFNNEKSQELKFEYDLKRTLIIYQQQVSKKFNFCLAGDTYVKSNNEFYNRTPYLKRAYLEYHKQGLSISAGLLVLEQFKYQRKIWQLRYIEKTFQNKFKYGENRNLGILIRHKINKNFSYDIAFTNGYNTPSKYSDKNLKIMLGQNFSKNNWFIKFYNSLSFNSDYEKVHSLLISKKLLNLNLGFEAAASYKNDNQINQDKEKHYGFSFFQNYSFNNHLMFFSRYDMNKNSKDKNNKSIILGGIQYSFKKYLKASLYYKNEDFNKNFWGISIFIHCINC